MSVQSLTRSALVAGALLLAAGLAPGAGNAQEIKIAIFAGGCFWCVESDFDQVEGVVETVSGYIGGTLENPGYRQVTAGGTGHYEAVKITYDPARVAYEELLSVFWHSVDPTDAGGQFCDRGDSYRTAIFATDEAQLKKAAATKAEVALDLHTDIATAILTAPTFYPAEGYHQDYYEKSSLKYKFYRYRCGRNARVRDVWGDKAFLGIKEHMG
jgi:peptide-methionine (S)-S-oxide reductase